MGRVRTIARRSFLIGSTALVGGVAFGTYAYKRKAENPLLADLSPGEVAFNPFVKIDGNGITLITPRADVGQGAYSIQAHLIASELDVDLDTVILSPGMPAAAYYNGIVAVEGMPIASVSEGMLARGARTAADVIGKLAGLQLTGGSTTVPDMYERLRMAGAVARETLVAAAMAQTGLRRDQLTTIDGAVVLPDGTRLAYVDLAADAAQLDPVEEVELRDPADWVKLTKPHQRTDIIAKSTGKQNYGIDMKLPGMVIATTRTNPALGGGMLGYDAEAALAMRGVQAVLPITGGFAVVADNTWRAFQAAQAIDVEWGPSPYIGDADAQIAALADSFTAEHQDSRFCDDGDVENALVGGDVIEAEYQVPYLAHAPLEPMSVIVKLEEGRLDVWTGTQIPRFVQDAAADASGLAKENVHVHVLMSGGSFGRRLEADYVRQAVEIAVATPNTPIKMIWQREEDFTHDFPRPAGLARARGAVADGQIQAFDLSIASTSVTESSLARLEQPAIGPDVAIVSGAWDQPFALPHKRVTGYRTPAMVPVASWRSVGASGNGFMHESFMDELCHAAGVDPLEERLRLCTHMPSAKVLEAVGEMSDWGRNLGPGRGRGLAFTLSFGVPVAQVCDVTATDDGLRIDNVFVAADVGKVLDPINFEAQLTGGVIWGLGHAMNCEITYEDGVAQQDNYHAFEAMRLYQTPEIEVLGLENGDAIKGIGEPGVPPAAPALGNAIFAATGRRVRRLPFFHEVDFL